MKKSKGGTATLRKKAWKLFSKHIRFCVRPHEGKCEYQLKYNRCFSCGGIYASNLLDAGHFKHEKLDFDEININPQCTHCNRFLHGNLWEYGKHLTSLYGAKAVEQLEGRAKIRGNYYTVTELQEIIKKYQ